MSRTAWLSALVLTLLLAMAGCASPPPAPGPPSPSIDAGPQSTLGRIGERAQDSLALDESALHLLATGQDALAARLALVESAERAVDLQYYIFRNDASGEGLIAALWRAAEQGVRVRLLLDDWGARPDDEALRQLAAHPRIEVRLFNPLLHPESPALSLLHDFERTQRRMHNKLMIADGRAAIVGGRNIGDEYFSRRRELEFGDIDVLAFGPVVPQLAAGFDRYWNDPLSAPVHAGASARLEPQVAKGQEAQSADSGPPASTIWARRLAAGEVRRFAGRATAVQDQPGKLDRNRPAEATELGHDIARLMNGVEREVLIVSPYFVPGEGGVAQLRELIRRGVRVTVVTNTLAATDVPAVHAGYARYRAALLEAGVALHEVRPDTPAGRRLPGGRTGSSRLSLHAKLLVVDRRTSFIGSMNIDPRSQRSNTENGIVVESQELAAELSDGVQRALVDQAWQVQLDGRRLLWRGSRDGALETLDHEPGAGLWLRLQSLLFSWLPIEPLL